MYKWNWKVLNGKDSTVAQRKSRGEQRDKSSIHQLVIILLNDFSLSFIFEKLIQYMKLEENSVGFFVETLIKNKKLNLLPLFIIFVSRYSKYKTSCLVDQWYSYQLYISCN